MRTRSSSNLSVVSPNPSTSNPKRHNRRRSKQPFILEESPIDTMADQRTMAELLRAPTEGYAEAIVVPPILVEQFEIKHSLINMMTTDQFFGLEKDNPHDHIRAARQWLEKELPHSIHTWEDLAWDRYKDLLRACPHHSFTELHQLDTFYNALNPADQDSLNAAASGNLLERRTQDVLTIIKNKSKQTSVVTTAMTAILKQFQATPPPASVKAVEEICVTCGGAHPYYQCLATSGKTFPELRDNIQGYVSAAVVNYNQGNSVYRPPSFLVQSNNKIKNMMASLLQMNTASTLGSGSLPSNIVANPKGELKSITTRSGLVINGPTVPTHPPFIYPEEDERVEETLTDPDLAEYTIKVPPPPVQKYKPPSQREYVVHQRDPLYPNMPYPSRMLKQNQQEKDEVQIHKFWQIELKCKALADLGASINLMPLSVWKKLGLPELISTHMTLKLANRAICTPAGIERDVFVLVGKFTFPADLVIVDYESDLRVPLILGRPFLRTARALIDVHGEEMILRDGFVSNQPSGNPTFLSHPELTLLKVKDDVFDLEGGNVLSEKLLDLDSTKDLHLTLHVNPLSGCTTYSSSNPLLEEFADELVIITFPLKYDDDLQFDIESDLKEIEFLLHRDINSNLKDLIDQSNLANPGDNFIDSMPEMFTDEHALDYASPSIFDEYVDDFLEVESDAENFYDDPFDSKGEKIKESKLLIDELDLPCDFLPTSEYDSFISKDFSRVDALPSANNEDKVFNPGILS
nr:reverse transcriptase domain-containing protein [Tanacetum cinerariifolium]